MTPSLTIEVECNSCFNHIKTVEVDEEDFNEELLKYGNEVVTYADGSKSLSAYQICDACAQASQTD